MLWPAIIASTLAQAAGTSPHDLRELTLYPVMPQATNVAGEAAPRTHYVGTRLGFAVPLSDYFSIEAGGFYNWRTDFSEPQMRWGDRELFRAPALLEWGAQVGAQLTPGVGSFTFHGSEPLHVSLLLSGAAGLGSTRVPLKAANPVTGPATYGDAGLQFVPAIGGGFRARLGEHLIFRLEVRDVVYSTRPNQVNGCDLVDLDVLDKASRQGVELTQAEVSRGCRASSFSSPVDAVLAKNAVRDPHQHLRARGRGLRRRRRGVLITAPAPSADSLGRV